MARLTETLFLLAAILIAITIFTGVVKPKLETFVNGTAKSIKVQAVRA
jgi:hypothetical protein